MTKPRRHAPRGRIKADPMRPPDPMSTHVGGDTLHGRLRCAARSKQKGIQCGRTAIAGGTVCRYHGGAAPQVMRSAEERLKALVDPAILRLHQLMMQDQFPSVAIAATKDVLDRDGKLGKAKETQDIDLKTEIVIRWQ